MNGYQNCIMTSLENSEIQCQKTIDSRSVFLYLYFHFKVSWDDKLYSKVLNFVRGLFGAVERPVLKLRPDLIGV